MRLLEQNPLILILTQHRAKVILLCHGDMEHESIVTLLYFITRINMYRQVTEQTSTN